MKHLLVSLIIFSITAASAQSVQCNGDTCIVILKDNSALKRIVKTVRNKGQRNVLVAVDKKAFGYCTADGKLVIPFTYDTALPFKNGYAPVEKGGLRGVIDSLGKVVIPIKYEGISAVSEGVAFFSSNKKLAGTVDLKGKEYTIDPKIVVDVSGNAIHNIPVDSFRIIHSWNNAIEYHFSEGLAIIGSMSSSKVVNNQGKYIFSSSYLLHDCKEGMFRLQKFISKDIYKYGFADNMGKVVIQPVYHSATDFKDGTSTVTTGNPRIPVKKIIDKTGAELK